MSVKWAFGQLLAGHYENNYGGAVRRLNAIDQRLAVPDWGAPVFELNALQPVQAFLSRRYGLAAMVLKGSRTAEPGTIFFIFLQPYRAIIWHIGNCGSPADGCR
jgi:hypothetical protein